MKRASQPDQFAYERHLWNDGVARVAGVDEAGRGPLAGPVVAAAVCLPPAWAGQGLPQNLHGLNDSKKLSASQRERFYAALTALPEVRHGIARIEADEIDALNILRATHLAMARALDQLQPEPEHILVDGLPVKTLRFKQTAIVKGDSLSFSIAAASVLAKVTRDRLMAEYDRLYPAYGFGAHKGYGTSQHIAALKEHGSCPIHRKSFSWRKPEQPELL